MSKSKQEAEKRKQIAWERAMIETLLNQSEIFRRQLPQLQACFPEMKITAIRNI